MLTQRQRLLYALFAAQLLAALVFGGIVVNGLDHRDTSRQLVASGQVASTMTGGSGGSSGSVVAGVAGSASNGTSGASAGPGRASGAVAASQAGVPSAGADASSGAAVAAGAPIKVGVLVTETGAINFMPAAQAAKAYFDMVNEQGGVNGHQLEVILRDDQLDPTRGHAEVQEMINDGVFAFAAWNAPLTEESIVPVLEQNRIPLVGNYGQLAEYQTEWAYPFTGFYWYWGWLMAPYMLDLGVKKPGVIFVSNGDAQTDGYIEKGFEDGFAARGVKLDPNNIYAVDVTKASYDDTVVQLRLAGVDGIGTILDNTAYVRLQQSLNRAGYHPIHVGDPLLADPSVVGDPGIGTSLNGAYVATDTDFIDTGGPAVQQYVSEVEQRFGSAAKVNWAGEVAWVGAEIFVQALRHAGANPTRQWLLAALDQMTTFGTGFTVPLTIRPGSHDINKCLKFGRIEAGKVVQTRDWTCSSRNYG